MTTAKETMHKDRVRWGFQVLRDAWALQRAAWNDSSERITIEQAIAALAVAEQRKERAYQ